MKAVLSPQRSCLTPVHSVSLYEDESDQIHTPDIEQLTKEKQGQGSH
jgi:hypothetical protein